MAGKPRLLLVTGRSGLTDDLLLPTLLFAALGGMTWAVRGSSGFGASAGCIFAGVALGAAWWFIAREPQGKQTRRYSSGWIILAMTVAFGIAGNRGWMQWPAFWDNRLYIESQSHSFVYIDRCYGFLWLFIAGVPWAGMGACMIAWCASGRRTAPWLWLVRLAFGIGMCYLLGVVLYDRYPTVFLPLYDSLKDKYAASPRGDALWKMIRDNREAMQQMGLYLGFLLFEVVRRDWKNVTLISTVGLVNGLGWSLLQNWSWAKRLWPGVDFNFWRCWESSGGISIGIAFAVAYFLVNRRMSEEEIEKADALRKNAPTPDWTWLLTYVVYVAALGYMAPEVMPDWGPIVCAAVGSLIAIAFGVGYYLKANEKGPRIDPAWSVDSPILERWGAYTGLILGLGISMARGVKGWGNIYYGNERMWDNGAWAVIGPMMAILMIVAAVWLLRSYRPGSPDTDVFPRAYALIWVVLLCQNVIAQCITGPHTSWSEVAFDMYYLLLFFTTMPIVYHFHYVKTHGRSEDNGALES